MLTIEEAKIQEQTQAPLLLFECTFADGSIHRWCTNRVVVDGQVYAARVKSHDSVAFSIASDGSIESDNRFSVQVANADGYVSQVERSVGWKGAQVKVSFVFYDLMQDVSITESRLLFRGIASSPEEISGAEARLSFANRFGLHRITLPDVRIQRHCPWMFPGTASERQIAMDGGSRGPYSRLYNCGYSAGGPGGFGNLDAGVPFTDCAKTQEACVARGMFDRDSSNAPTARFGGFRFVPSSILVRSHGEKGFHNSAVSGSEVNYDDCVPLVYGTVWYEPLVVFARNDGNLTRMEVLLCSGEIDGVVKVIVNGSEVPEAIDGGTTSATGWFNVISKGARQGEFNANFADATGKPIGDPHGSMAVLSVCVPNRVSDGRSLPRVQTLIRGMRLARYDAGGAPVEPEFSNNPAWVLLDLLRRCGWSLHEIDLGSFAKCAAFCAEPINAQVTSGPVTSVPRYQCNLAIRKRRSAAELVRGVRAASLLRIGYGANGLLQLVAERGLSDESPTKPAGSNSDAALPGGGWPAYEFSDGSASYSGILRRANRESSFKLSAKQNPELPNRISVEFQNEFNEYQQDSLSVSDSRDIELCGYEISSSSPALGLPNVDQAWRICRTALSKSLYGNSFVQFDTSVRAVGLVPGAIIAITHAKENLTRQAFRITRVEPSTNFRTCRIVAQIHNDVWYARPVDAVASNAGRHTGFGSKAPRVLSGPATVDGLESFGVEETITTNSEGVSAAALEVSFIVPRSPTPSRAGIPIVGLVPTVSPSGGTLRGGRSYTYAISGIDSSGVEGLLSYTVIARVPPGSDVNTVALTGLAFSADTQAFRVYRGATSLDVRRIAEQVALAQQFVDHGLLATSEVPPDPDFDHANFYWRYERNPPVAVTTSGALFVGSDTLSLLPNTQVGAVVRITAGSGVGQERWIGSNTATELQLSLPWDIAPDSTSFFAIADPGWSFGTVTNTSPGVFEVENRSFATIHITGRSANALDLESPRQAAIVRRWTIGSSANGVDTGTPPEPQYSVSSEGDGTLELSSLGFLSLLNTRSVTSGTLTLWVHDELQTTPGPVLASSLDSIVAQMQLSVPLTLAPGQLVQIGTEVVRVEEGDVGGLEFSVSRGVSGSLPTGHASGAVVYVLRRASQILSFPRDFFGSPASGGYSFRFPMPNVRLAASDLFVTNRFGNGLTTSISFTSTPETGLRTLNGGQISLEVEGYLAIQDFATPRFVVDGNYSIRDVFATLSEAATGGAVRIEIRRNSTLLVLLEVPDGQPASPAVDGRLLGPLLAHDILDLDITVVPQAAGTLPGKDLTVTIRL